MNVHKIYLGSIVVLCLGAVIVGGAWREHVRDEARRDAVIDAQKSDVASLEQRIAAAKQEVQTQIAELERRGTSLPADPARAPQMIRELVPMQSPIQQSTPLTPQSPPDSPSAVLTKQHDQLAGCRRPSVCGRSCTPSSGSRLKNARCR